MMDLPSVGLALIEGRENAAGMVAAIRRAEQQGVPMVWATLGPRTPDAPTLLAAAAVTTSTIGLGTAIVPTYPRHPVALASQTLVLSQLAPHRVRLGIGPSHLAIIEDLFGLPMGNPLAHLREYVVILRSLLWEGQVDFKGHYYTVRLTIDQLAPVPIYLSALRTHAFELAGEIADGVISWLCPISYLREHAVPALQRGALKAGRAVPRLVAQVPVVMTTNPETMRQVAQSQISVYCRLPFYAAMFERAGYPIDPKSAVPPALLEHLVVWGNDTQVQERIQLLLGDGIDELALTLIAVDDPVEEGARLADIVSTINRP